MAHVRRIDMLSRVAGEKSQKPDEFITRSQLVAGSGITLDVELNHDIVINAEGLALPPGTTDGDVLTWDETTEDWVPEPLPTMTLPAGTVDNILRHNGTDWAIANYLAAGEGNYADLFSINSKANSLVNAGLTVELTSSNHKTGASRGIYILNNSVPSTIGNPIGLASSLILNSYNGGTCLQTETSVSLANQRHLICTRNDGLKTEIQSDGKIYTVAYPQIDTAAAAVGKVLTCTDIDGNTTWSDPPEAGWIPPAGTANQTLKYNSSNTLEVSNVKHYESENYNGENVTGIAIDIAESGVGYTTIPVFAMNHALNHLGDISTMTAMLGFLATVFNEGTIGLLLQEALPGGTVKCELNAYGLFISNVIKIHNDVSAGEHIELPLYDAGKLLYTNANRAMSTLADGSPDQVLTTDGAGGYSWNDPLGDGHTHTNKDVLDDITAAGDGDLFLADDGTYKAVPVTKGLVLQTSDLVMTGDTGDTIIFPILNFTAKANKKYKLNYVVTVLHTDTVASDMLIDVLVGDGTGTETAFGNITYSPGNTQTVLNAMPLIGGVYTKLYDLTTQETEVVVGLQTNYESIYFVNAILANGSVDKAVWLRLKIPPKTPITTPPDTAKTNSYLTWEEF